MNKKIGFIGLGRMGRNMVLNLLSKKYKVIVYNRDIEKVKEMEKEGAIGAYSLEELVNKLGKEKIIIMMITAGKPIDEVISGLSGFLSKGDILIDGGNSFYEDSVRRYELLNKKGINYLDMGTSGGLEGARNGACLTIGGEKNSFDKIEFLFRDLATKNGYAYLGDSGSGHFAKMIHNGIEYSLLESYAEGFELLAKSKYKFNYSDVSKVWSNGSVIRSWITELAERVFRKNPELKDIKGVIGGGETGSWAYNFAKKTGADADCLKHAIEKRKESEKKQSFGTKLIALLRNEFGGHEVKK